jgi:hypothetical protein
LVYYYDMPTPTPTPSLAERIVTTMRSPHSTEADLQRLLLEIEETPDADKSHILQRLKESVQTLNEHDRASIRNNLQTLERRTYTQLTAVDLEQLRAVTDVMRTQLEEPPAPEAAARPESAPTPAPAQPDTAAEQKWYNPATWTREQQLRAATYAGAGVVVVGGMVLAGWMWNRVKRRAKQASAVVQKGWGWLKWGTLAAVLTVGGGLGIRAAWKWRERLAMLRALEQKLHEANRQMQEAIRTGNVALQQHWKQQLELLKQQEQLVQSGKSATSVDSGNAAPAERTERRDPVIPPNVREAVQEVAQSEKEALLARMVVQAQGPRWNLDESSKINQMTGLIRNNGHLTMGEIEAAMNDPDRASPFIMAEDTNDPENRKQSSDTLVYYCDMLQPRVRESLMRERDLTPEQAEEALHALPLIDFLDCALRNANAVMRAISDLQQHGTSTENILRGLNSMNHQYILGGDAFVQQALDEMLREASAESLGISEEELASIDIVQLLSAAMHSRHGTVRNECMHLRSKTDATPSEKVLLFVFEKLMAEDNITHKIMLPLFHGVFPSSEHADPETRIRMYLLDRMTPAEALRFYLYHRMLAQGNALALPLLQIDIVRFIARHDDSKLPYKKYAIMTRIGGSLAANGISGLAEEWEKMGIDLNVELTDEQIEVMKVVGKVLLASPFVGLLEQGGALLGVVTAYPKHFAAGVGAQAVARTVWTRTAGPLFLDSMTDPKRFSTLLDSIADGTGISQPTRLAEKVRKGFSPLVYTYEEMRQAKHLFNNDIFHAIESISGPNAAHTQKNLKQLLSQCLQNPRLAHRWNTLAIELGKYSASHTELIKAADAAKKLASASPQAARWRGVLNAMRLPFRWGGVGRNIVFLGMPAICNAATVATDRAMTAVGRGIAAIPGRQIVSGVASRARQAVSAIPVPPALQHYGKYVKAGVVFNAALVGVEGVSYFTHERPRLLEEIEAETDPAKRAQLERELDYGHSASLGFNTLGTGLFYVPGAQPVAIAVLGANAAGQVARKSVEEGTTYMLTNERDLAGQSAGHMMQHIGKTAPGKNATWGQSFAARPAHYLRSPILIQDPIASWIVPDMSKTFDAANATARMEGYSAYFRQASLFTLPPLQKEDLSAADRSLSPEHIQERLAQRTADEQGYFATSALTFLKEKTDGSFVQVAPDLLHQAETYAFTRTMEHRIFMRDPDNATPDQRTVTEKVAEAEQNTIARETLRAMEIASLANQPELLRERAPWMLLTALQHELAACEAKILTTNFSNWTSMATGYWRSEDNLRTIARGAIATDLIASIKDFIRTLESSGGVEPIAVAEHIALLRASLTQNDPNAIAFQRIDQKADAPLAALGSETHLLSIPGLLPRFI